MKKISLLLIGALLFFSCQKDSDIEDEIFLTETNEEIESKSQIDASCYTLEATFDKDWYDYSQAYIKLKVTIYFGGFGPGLYLGEYTVQDHQTIRLEIPEIYRDSYQFSPTDRFKFEGVKMSSNDTLIYRDVLIVNQLGGKKTYYNLLTYSPYRSNTFKIRYASLDIESCE